jgi:hypothetical protein
MATAESLLSMAYRRVFTSSMPRALRLAKQIDAGNVNIKSILLQ